MFIVKNKLKIQCKCNTNDFVAPSVFLGVRYYLSSFRPPEYSVLMLSLKECWLFVIHLLAISHSLFWPSVDHLLLHQLATCHVVFWPSASPLVGHLALHWLAIFHCIFWTSPSQSVGHLWLHLWFSIMGKIHICLSSKSGQTRSLETKLAINDTVLSHI